MTVIDLLTDIFPPEYVDAIVMNMDDINMLDEEAMSLYEELTSLFDWENSLEGFDFWHSVLEAVENNTELPELPMLPTIYWKPSTYVATKKGHMVMNVDDTGVDFIYGYNKRNFNRASEASREKYYQWVN